LKEDLWKIINREKINDIDFFTEVLNELLDRKHINFHVVYGIGEEVRKNYEESISYFYDEMDYNFDNGILKAIKNSINFLEKKIKKWDNVISDINGRR